MLAKRLTAEVCPQKVLSCMNNVPNITRIIIMMNPISTIPLTLSILSDGIDSIIIAKGNHPSEMGNISRNIYHQENNEISAQIKPNTMQTSNVRQ